MRSKVRLLSREGLFSGLPPEIEGGRYHSWAVDDGGFPPELRVTARDEDGLIMAFCHRSLEIYGVQFHPESILTPSGPAIVRNFLSGAGTAQERRTAVG